MSKAGSHTKEYWAAWREKNREKIRAYQKKYYYENLESNRAKTRVRANKYRASGKAILQDRWRELGASGVRQLYLWQAQDALCALCKAPLTFRKAHLDHCHTTGRIRGFLCPPCNKGLGHFKDNPHALRAAADYIERKGF